MSSKGRGRVPSKLVPIEDGAGGQNSKPRKIFAKKDLIEAVRKIAPNKPVVKTGSGSMARSASVPESNQLTIMETGVNLNARRYNDLKITADRKAVELKKRLDTLACLKMENDALSDMKAKKTPESNRIEELTDEIKKANQETENKLHYRRQLEHMLRRLQKNQITFDAHINAMEEALGAAEREHEDVKALMRQLEAGKTKAVLDLHEIQRSVAVERRDRNRVISMRQNEANNAAKMEAWRVEREEMRAEFASEMRGDLSIEEERQLQTRLQAREADVEKLQKENEENTRQLNKLEEQFTQVRQATGVNSLEEMVDKFVGQEGNRNALIDERKDVEGRLADAKRRKEEAEQRFSELKASGIGSTELNREISDELNHKILSGRMELKVTKAACERLEGVLVALRQGATGLFQRLQTFMHLLESEGLQSGDVATMEPIEAINLSEFILSKMMESVGGGEASPSRFNHTMPNEEDSVDPTDPGAGNDEASTWSSLGLDDLPNPRNNVRVRSMVEQRDMDAQADDSYRPTPGRISEEEEKGGEDMENVSDHMVPDREFIKLSSSRQHSEMLRKKESDARRKKMQERLEAADEADKKNLSSMASRKKQQRDAINKLTERPEQIGMPKGISMKDDPITRSNAFLTQMPELL
mmetsp:Transcript_33452/g.77297  ORF Transcript_33452/g.77297 Transcript_33452/m.77297 type:complete len:645 (+) Transcript_33452:256-2190(+)|eukprot:CAMPEP_0119524728 /NCGR_PEP_ID=MMETSP1344-20130328/39624_1 /TAXON_ID=236787 /ORGANISM="Florenciella parvula, Strain CCMP2471" /LENGTH=644 /DNA_ID=CAMNT_0007563317 /DNA_START=230 /DNA_END=2164 /DNA_ORIENTATION=+